MAFVGWARMVPGLALGAALLALTGCKGFWNAPTTTTTTGSTTTLTSGNFYVLNAGASEIAGYYVNAGTLTSLSGSPYLVPATPLAIAVAPDNNFLYVSTISGIYVYSIASNGALTISNASTAITSDPATSMAISSSSNWLVEAVPGAASVYALAVDPTTGLLRSTAEQAQVLPVATIQQVTMAPNDTYAIVSMGTGGTALIPFTTGNTNPFGAVTTIGPVNAAGSALSAAVDPSNRVLYIGETAAVSGTNSGGIRVFNLTTLVEQSGSPYGSGGLAPYWILPEAGGQYVYAVNRQTSAGSTGAVAGFTLSQSANIYQLTAMSSTFATGTHPVAAVEDSSHQFVFAVDYDGNPDLMGYVFDTTTAGALDQVVATATGTDPVYANAIGAAH